MLVSPEKLPRIGYRRFYLFAGDFSQWEFFPSSCAHPSNKFRFPILLRNKQGHFLSRLVRRSRTIFAGPPLHVIFGAYYFAGLRCGYVVSHPILFKIASSSVELSLFGVNFWQGNLLSLESAFLYDRVSFF